jgi:tetratricopeptide (TPR) repeat protein
LLLGSIEERLPWNTRNSELTRYWRPDAMYSLCSWYSQHSRLLEFPGSADYTCESMNGRLCYRRNLAPHLHPDHRIGCERTRTSLATSGGILCALACLWLIACGKSATQYIDRGNQLYAAGQYNDATLNYRNALKKAPNSGEAYYRLGLALLKQNQVGDAYQAFNHAVSLDPGNVPAKIQLANLSLLVYARDPRHPPVLYKQAESIADELLKPGGDRVQGLRIKGSLALIDNHTAVAVQALRDAARIAPNNADVGGELAQALLRDNQPDEAEKAARLTVQRHPRYNQAYEVLYAIYGTQHNWEKAEALLKLWVANNPKESSPVLRLAAFYYARKQPDDGEKVLNNSMLDRRTQFPQADLLVGDFHALIRNPEKALADYQRGESRDHARQQVYQERAASMLATLGRREDAMKAADAILAKDPKNQFARALKVEVLERMGGAKNLDNAATLANGLAQEAPSNARVQLLAGQAFLMKGSLDDAHDHLARAAQADPRSLTAQVALARLEMLRKNYPAVLEHANAALAIRQNDPTARLFRVIGLTGTHSYGAAKTEAEQLARDTKDAPQVEMQLGVIALGQGHYAEAEELFRKLYKGGPSDLQPLAGLVNTYEAEHQPDRALALMEQETERSPESSGKEALLVATAEADGKTDVALSQLQKMAAQNPASADVQIRIGALEQKNDKLPEALRAFERARQLAPQRKGLDQMIASIEDRMGKKAEAIADYRSALAKSPGDSTALNNLAFLLADTGGDTKEALQLVNTAIRQAPNVPQLRDTVAWIQIKRHNTAEALPILQALTDKYPQDPTFRYHYAVALIDSGDRAAAKLQVAEALSNKPPTELAGELRNLLAQAK